MNSKRIEIFPEIKFLERIVRETLRQKGESEKIFLMDRLMDNYKLLLGKEGDKRIDPLIAKELGAAVIIYASGMTSEERGRILDANRIEGFGKNVQNEIGSAVQDCLHVKKSYTGNSREVGLPRSVLGSLLSLLVHMDGLGDEDIGLFSVIEDELSKKASLDLYGKIPGSELMDMVGYKLLKDSTERRLERDGSVVSAAILLLLKTRYYIAPVEGFLNMEIRMEIRARRMWLKTETERLVRRKMKYEKSIEL